MVSQEEPSGPVPGVDIKPTLTTTMRSDQRPVPGRQAMAAAQISADNTAAGPPVACSLTRAGLAEQAGRWERLAARAMTAREQTGDGIRVSFRRGPGTEEE